MSGINDPISDMIIRIKNANQNYFKTVDIPYSKMKAEILRLLKEHNFIKNYKMIKDRKQGILRVYLLYGENKERYLTDMKRVSTSGRRIYRKAKKIENVRGEFGLTIVSTPKGLMSAKKAKEENIGGEVICYVW
ncbi:MAG TPA: 30S ribosomal protein S8 [bacterium]|nr:30S ribosomal protein S8 [bacterium]